MWVGLIQSGESLNTTARQAFPQTGQNPPACWPSSWTPGFFCLELKPRLSWVSSCCLSLGSGDLLDSMSHFLVTDVSLSLCVSIWTQRVFVFVTFLDMHSDHIHYWEFIPVRDVSCFFFSHSPPLPSALIPSASTQPLLPFFLLYSLFPLSLPSFPPRPAHLNLFSSFSVSITNFGPYSFLRFLTPEKTTQFCLSGEH